MGYRRLPSGIKCDVTNELAAERDGGRPEIKEEREEETESEREMRGRYSERERGRRRGGSREITRDM